MPTTGPGYGGNPGHEEENARFDADGADRRDRLSYTDHPSWLKMTTESLGLEEAVSLLTYPEQLHIKNQSCVWRDDTAGTTSPVA